MPLREQSAVAVVQSSVGVRCGEDWGLSTVNLRAATAVVGLALTATLVVAGLAGVPAQQTDERPAVGPWMEQPFEGMVTPALAWLDATTAAAGCESGVVIFDTAGRHRVIALNAAPRSPGTVVASPDGRMVALLVGGSEALRAFIVDVEDGALVPLTDGDPSVAFDRWGAWSDGPLFCYTSDEGGAARARNGTFRIYGKATASGRGRPLTSAGPWSDTCPSFARDGGPLVFLRTYDDRPSRDAISADDGPMDEARVMALDLTTDVESSLTEGSVDYGPLVSPDGEHVAFFRLSGTIGVSLWIARPSTGQAWPVIGSELTNLSMHSSLQWTSDGAGLYLASRGKVYRVPILTGPLQRMDLEEAVDAVFAVSPDDAHIAYLTDGGYRIEEVTYAD